ncbi:zinc ribbon domain-containing protein [Psychrobacter sp.]|uniref:zinc ribbon domain-containing protein n=1 Tax=Psychrobacter sp. TaxID=56811 RepID=UPI0025D6BC84|nr:zinc ribbon domain-containing protein [Psychrobacter sp.]
MPVYDYKCENHGVFHELVALSEYAATKPCPHCLTQSKRVILVAPVLLNMDANKRQACACNEKAQHEPKHSSRLLRPDSMQSANTSSTTMLTSDGNKYFPTQRPWMISH